MRGDVGVSICLAKELAPAVVFGTCDGPATCAEVGCEGGE